MANRKLGRPSDQRIALLRNQVTSLIWYGKIETTLPRAKEVSSIAEHLITIAMRECDNTIATTKESKNDKLQIVTKDVVNDAPARLAARRQVMKFLYDIPVMQGKDEDKVDYLKVSEGLGAQAFEITKREEVDDVIRKAMEAEGPVVIRCELAQDDKVWPMVAPGAPIEEAFSEEDLNK